VILCLAGPNWLKNIYFNYLLTLRAITKAAPLWIPTRFHSGDAQEDEEVASIVDELIQSAPRWVTPVRESRVVV
jgi:hypothetical protein